MALIYYFIKILRSCSGPRLHSGWQIRCVNDGNNTPKSLTQQQNYRTKLYKP